MIGTNPFAPAMQSLPAGFMEWYLGLMAAAVIVGVLVDITHKGSAKYFFANMKESRAKKGARQVEGGELVSIAAQTAVVDVLASGEFCNPRRRIAHLLTMYGFLLYVATTAIMVFGHPVAAGSIVPVLWWIGALLVAVGGYWFWFFIRVDVAAEGNSPFRIVRADLFILSLLASCTLGLLWAWLQAAGSSWTMIFLGLYLIATTVLFGSVLWSKFLHMFFKPAAAFQKRVAEANGTRSNLPKPADKPAVFGTVDRLPRNY